MASIDVGVSVTTLDALGERIHVWARGKGFYDREFLEVEGSGCVENPSLPAEKLMLIVSECSEVMDALRDGDREAEAVEVADIAIRLLDYAVWRGISLDKEVPKKMRKNRGRPHMHGRKF